MKDAWRKAFIYAGKATLTIDKSLYLDIHSSIGREKAVEWGIFRTGFVGIAGTTSYASPAADCLDSIFKGYSGI